MKFRVIPTILTNGNTVVKGTNFNNWRTVGSAQATALLYASRNVDELMFLDVTATQQSRVIDPKLIQYFSSQLNVPFSVGGGIRTLEDARICMRAGAEKVILGTSAIINPSLVSDIAKQFGSQAVTIAIDVDSEENEKVTSHSGTIIHDIKPLEFALDIEKRGAGELMVQTKSQDGVMEGLFLKFASEIIGHVNIPVIVSSGVGKLSDFEAGFEEGASAVASGSFFQFTQFTPMDVREHLREKGIPVRQI